MFKELLNKLTPLQAQRLSECKTVDEIIELMGESKIEINKEDCESFLKMLLEKDKELSDEILGLVSGGGPLGFICQSNAVKYRSCPKCKAVNSFAQDSAGGPRTCRRCGFSHDSNG